MVSCKSVSIGENQNENLKGTYVSINSGGALFRYAVPEFEKGLVGEEYKEKYCGWLKELCS